MRFNHLDDWLTWQEKLNPAEIELGLERVSAVLTRAGLSSTFQCPLIIVAGTNGKGSVVAMLEAMARALNLKVCSYTSPHIFQYNERFKINAQAVDDDMICESFERIDQARADSQLTYFEFGTLAAIDLFFRQEPDLVILEVGLGGRLDAVNVMNGDVSVITSVAIDHIDWLGSDRESIGYEKAGVMRTGKPVVCGDRKPPDSVIEMAKKLQCDLYQIGLDYDVVNDESASKTEAKAEAEEINKRWTLQSRIGHVENLTEPSLLGEFQKSNAATAMLALQILHAQGRLLLDKKRPATLDHHTLCTALQNINLQGRFQKINSSPQVFVDVAHNAQAAEVLAAQVKVLAADGQGKTWAIVAMLADKDVSTVLSTVSTEIDCWCLAGLEDVGRGLSVDALVELGRESLINQCTIQAPTVEEACDLVLSNTSEKDRVIIFGSFYTVAAAMIYFKIKKDENVQ
jgi:dihydrofolate synthase/folylpolyglutamate synthase